MSREPARHAEAAPAHRAPVGRPARRQLLAALVGLLLLAGLGVAAQALRPHPTANVDHVVSPTAAGPTVGPTASPSVAAGPSSATRAPAPAPGLTASSSPPKSQTGTQNPAPSNQRTIQAFVTGYSYFDNTPPGSVDISNPVLHQVAGGTGTYADPITVAVGHSLIGGRDILDWPAGTRFYIPNLRRYFIAEDTCGDGSSPQTEPCHVGYPKPATTWLDLWIGGKGGTADGANSCMDAITGVWTVLVNPVSTDITTSGPLYGPSGCTNQYGNSVVSGL